MEQKPLKESKLERVTNEEIRRMKIDKRATENRRMAFRIAETRQKNGRKLMV